MLTPTDKAAKALPCPFCGSPANTTKDLPDIYPDASGGPSILRPKCRCSNPICVMATDGKGMYIVDWNRRAPSSLELRLRELEKEMRDMQTESSVYWADRIESLMEGKP